MSNYSEMKKYSQTMFQREIRADYQSYGIINPDLVNTKSVSGAETIRFNKMGAASSFEHIPGSYLPNAYTIKDTIEVTMSSYVATEQMDVLQQDLITIAMATPIKNSLAAGLARRRDWIITQPIFDNTYTTDTTITATTGTSYLTLEVLQKATKYFESHHIPRAERYCLIHPDQLMALMSDSKVSSFDYNTQKVLVNGDMDSFFGFNFIKFPAFTVDANRNLIGGIKEYTSGSDQMYDTYFFHGGKTGAIAYAYNPESVRANMDYLPQTLSMMFTATLTAGAGIIDKTSVLKFAGKKYI